MLPVQSAENREDPVRPSAGTSERKIPNSAEFLGFDSIPVQPWSAEPSVVRSDFSWMQSILEC
jgi:hypothetical protein